VRYTKQAPNVYRIWKKLEEELILLIQNNQFERLLHQSILGTSVSTRNIDIFQLGFFREGKIEVITFAT